MPYRFALPILLTLAATGAHAQTMPRLPGGTGLPDVGKMGAPNVAGVLGYCVKNKLVSGSGADSVINGLKGKSGVTASPEYSAGEAGNIITGSSSPVSIDAMPAQLKSQACNAVLRHGSSLL